MMCSEFVVFCFILLFFFFFQAEDGIRDRSPSRGLGDVYIMPSVSEPFGISPLEAMQMGVPSIISKQSGCAEILNNVIKVDYWDTNAIADAIYSIIKYPAMYKELREKGLEEVKQIVWEKAGAKVIDIYKSLINR